MENVRKNRLLCYKDGFIDIYVDVYEDIYVDIAKNVEKRFDTSNYELERPLPRGKTIWINEKGIGWENNGRICYITTENIQLFSR